jgi:hypothetical protein
VSIDFVFRLTDAPGDAVAQLAKQGDEVPLRIGFPCFASQLPVI